VVSVPARRPGQPAPGRWRVRCGGASDRDTERWARCPLPVRSRRRRTALHGLRHGCGQPGWARRRPGHPEPAPRRVVRRPAVLLFRRHPGASIKLLRAVTRLARRDPDILAAHHQAPARDSFRDDR